MISSCRAKTQCHPRSHLAWQNEDLISVVVVYYAMLMLAKRQRSVSMYDMIPGSCSDITCPDNVKIKAIWGSLDCRSVESLLSRPQGPLQIRRSGDQREPHQNRSSDLPMPWHPIAFLTMIAGIWALRSSRPLGYQ